MAYQLAGKSQIKSIRAFAICNEKYQRLNHKPKYHFLPFSGTSKLNQFYFDQIPQTFLFLLKSHCKIFEKLFSSFNCFRSNPHWGITIQEKRFCHGCKHKRLHNENAIQLLPCQYTDRIFNVYSLFQYNNPIIIAKPTSKPQREV